MPDKDPGDRPRLPHELAALADATMTEAEEFTEPQGADVDEDEARWPAGSGASSGQDPGGGERALDCKVPLFGFVPRLESLVE